MDKIIRKTYQASETKAVGESRSLVVTISTINPDRSKDVVLPSGVKLDNYLRNPVVAFAHKYDGLAVAKASDIQINGDNIMAKVTFPAVGVSPLSDQLYELYKEGFMNAWSIGFIPLKYVENADGGKDFAEWELLEFSAVLVPDNPEALTIARSKGLNIDPVLEAVKDIEKAMKDEKKKKEIKEEKKEDVLTVSVKIADNEVVLETLEKAKEIIENQQKEIESLKVESKDVSETVALADVIAHLNWLAHAFEENKVDPAVVARMKDALNILMEVLKVEAVIGQKQFVAKSGRVLSTKNRNLIKSCIEQMTEASEALKALHDATESAQEEDKKEVSSKTFSFLKGVQNELRRHDKETGLILRSIKQYTKIGRDQIESEVNI